MTLELAETGLGANVGEIYVMQPRIVGRGRVMVGDTEEFYQPGEMFLVLGFVNRAINEQSDTPYFIEFLRLNTNRKVLWHPKVAQKHLKKMEPENDPAP